jgi:hypothetical protein
MTPIDNESFPLGYPDKNRQFRLLIPKLFIRFDDGTDFHFPPISKLGTPDLLTPSVQEEKSHESRNEEKA